MTQPSNPGVPEGQSAPQASPSQTPQRASAPGQPVQQAPAAQSAPTPITREQGPAPQAAPDPGPRTGQGAQDAQPQTGPQARRKPSVGKLIADITSQFSSIVRGEIELAKVQTATMFARIRTGLVLMAAAAVFALFLLGWILHTIEAALATVLPVWAASLIIVGLLAVVVAVLALLGSRALRKAQESKPDPKAGITEAVHIVKNGLTK